MDVSGRDVSSANIPLWASRRSGCGLQQFNVEAAKAEQRIEGPDGTSSNGRQTAQVIGIKFLVSCVINGVKTRMLLATGAQVSVIGKAVGEVHVTRSTSQVFGQFAGEPLYVTAANGSHIPFNGWIEADLEILSRDQSRCSTRVPFVVSKSCLDCPFLGINVIGELIKGNGDAPDPWCPVYIDNNLLTYILSTACLAGHRWVGELADIYFDIKYHPGKANIDADTLSRYPVLLQEVMGEFTKSLSPDIVATVWQGNKATEEDDVCLGWQPCR
ncbi:hypothetical protein AOLI_G00018260 [Acnodon oligacanthus]